MVETPHLAAEVTIQPVDELAVDAAIIFSDILVIPEAMGLTYEMVEKRGPLFPKTIQNSTDIDNLAHGAAAAAELQYVFDAIEITVKELAGRVPLIGFAGAPWTILAYMVEGSGSKTFSKAKKFLYQEPVLAHQLLQKITDITIAYLQLKIKSGVNLIQVFDSWAGILSPNQFRTFALPYIRQIATAIKEVPVTIFAKGAWFAYQDLADVDCNVVGIDWNTSPFYAKALLKDKVCQGNLDPCQLYGHPKDVEKATLRMVQYFGDRHIANLGHGVYPDTPLDNVRVFVETVKNYRY